jgi:WD40 repeat protein
LAAIFISHASVDGQHAAGVKQWLASRGYEQVFLDLDKAGGMRAGEDWERRLYEEVARCHAVILLITPAWLASKWCFAEFAMARSLGKVIFPIVLMPDEGVVIGPELRSIQVERWNEEGQAHLASRLEAVAHEIARGHRFDPRRSPYPGILAFEAEDAAVFFGRDSEIRQIAERLEARRVQGGARLLLVVGASGSGKSSVLKAGVLPWIGRDARSWIRLSAFRPGEAPLTRLAKVLAEGLGDAGKWQLWRERLAAAPRAALAEAIELLQIGPAREATVVLAIDQLEEAFTITGESERAAFLRALASIADRPRPLAMLVVATVRADLINEILKTQDLDLAHEVYTLGPLAAERLADVIEGPAEVAAIILEPGLARHILQDAKRPESLPLLAFALRELNERYGADKRLEILEYERLGDPAAKPVRLSPLENVVRRKAEETIYAAAPSAAELAALKEAFIGALVQVNQEGVRLRRPARLEDLPGPARPLIEMLVGARLLSKRMELETSLVEVAHEALFHAWPLLSSWLDEEQDFLIGRRRVEEAGRFWRAATQQQKDKALLSGLLLERAREWNAKNPDRFTGLSHFVQASIARDDAEKVRAQRLNDQALIGQSRLLVDLSRQQFEEGDCGTAAMLALEALPDTGRKVARPYVPQAEAALYHALSFIPHSAVRFKGTWARAVFSPDGRRLVAAIGQTGILYDTANGQEIAKLSGHRGKRGDIRVYFSPESRRLATIAEEEGIVRVWNAASGAELLVLRAHKDGVWNKNGVWNLAFSPDGARIVTCSPDRTARVWDVDSGAEIMTLRHDNWVGRCAFSPDGTRILTCTSAPPDNKGSTAARIWNATDGTEIAVLRPTENANAFYSPTGTRIATTGYRTAVRLWDAAGQEVAALGGHDDDITVTVTLSPDGGQLLTISRHMARLWDTAGGKEIAQLRMRDDYLTESSTFLPVGIRIFTSAADGTLRIWDPVSGAEVAVLRGHHGHVSSAVFSPDGERLLTTSSDRTARVWNLAKRTEIAVLDDEGNSARLSPDGTRIVTDGYLWRIFPTTRDLVDHARSVGASELTAEQRQQFFLE